MICNENEKKMDVHLAHVVARVVPLNLPDVKFPSVVTVVTHLMLGFVFCYRFTMGGLQKPVVAHECDIVTQGPSIEVPGALNLSSQPVGTTPMRWPSIHIQVKHCPLYSKQTGRIVIMF